jgi:hypothetical protein
VGRNEDGWEQPMEGRIRSAMWDMQQQIGYVNRNLVCLQKLLIN